MKHAYLIMAHNEFAVLQQLIIALDDPRNDIYVHIDKKVRQLPHLKSLHANLYVLENRVDVRWGSVSQIKAEYVLFEAAYSRQEYDRYHLISGTHLPIKTSKEIIDFFTVHRNEQVVSSMYTNAYEVNMKLARFHFFLNYFREGNSFQKRFANFLWNVSLKMQYLLHIQKTTPKVTIKANNWVSLTHQAVGHLLNQKKIVFNVFRWSFCGDEFLVPYLFENKESEYKILDYSKLLYNDFQGSNPRVLTMDDYEFLCNSDYLFARKFSSNHIDLVYKIVEKVRV
ncbi:beta-1,6-N-acetylglucosaminyltransferase [Sphingobacterium sp. LRF_L2]|uniref:beta-1,6-N-acetylglucosaminyltransferase n=1 Tax=Sphingobacterium sp. LRF_L2 TaxID=3369421 RepID=UPI003F625FE0